jgi:hypothetical protein
VGVTNVVVGFAIGLGVVALPLLLLTRGRLGYQPNWALLVATSPV